MPTLRAPRALLVALMALFFGGLLIWHGDRPAGAQQQAPDAAASSAQVLVVGDSLGVGLRPTLGTLLSDDDLTWNVVSGRTTPQGLAALRQELETVHPRIVVMSLGTNDGPSPARFTRRIERALSLIPADSCVVWADIYRPARKGPYHALNVALRREAARHRRLVLVDWTRVVLAHEVVLPDGLHPDATGFALRSRLIAAAVRDRCPAA